MTPEELAKIAQEQESPMSQRERERRQKREEEELKKQQKQKVMGEEEEEDDYENDGYDWSFLPEVIEPISVKVPESKGYKEEL